MSYKVEIGSEIECVITGISEPVEKEGEFGEFSYRLFTLEVKDDLLARPIRRSVYDKPSFAKKEVQKKLMETPIQMRKASVMNENEEYINVWLFPFESEADAVKSAKKLNIQEEEPPM